VSTTPPNEPSAPAAGDRHGRDDHLHPPLGMGFFPGNAELVVWIAALLVAMLVTWVADSLGPSDWMSFFLWTSAAYLLSRGIAKASRVYEM
jgi:hypothetical protein